jgi:hypothetical protein
VYDRFIVEKGMLQGPEIGEMLKGLQENDSFRPRFDRFVQPYADHLAVHEGDILQKNWDGRPIEICFIDVAKTWAIQNWVVTQWFPNLRPGSIVVQQDFFHNYTGYIPMVMEHYADYFELIDALEWETAVFLCTKQIPAEACRMDFSKDIPLERQLELTDRSARRFDPLRQALMECQKIYLVTCAGDPDRARSMLRLSAQQYSGWPRIKWLLEKMENRLKRGEAPLRQETDPIPPRSPGNPQLAEPSECNVSTV